MGKINEKGISLIILSVTIIVILIIASIAIYYGTETINRANVETIRTNMLLIKAKSSEYCEEANFKLGTAREPQLAEGQLETDEEYINRFSSYIIPGFKYLENKNAETGMKEDEKKPAFTRTDEYTSMTNATYKQFVTKVNSDPDNAQIMGLKGVEHLENYIILFDIIQNKVEIFYTEGVKDKNGNLKYSLTDIEEI